MNLSIYDFPDAFEVVMHRPPEVLAAEVAAIDQLLTRRNVPQGQILELACGACAHGIPLAQAGHQVTGLDRSLAMLASAAAKAQQVGVTLTLIQADIVEFTLPTSGFDAAIFMYETFPVITEHDDLLRHFAAVRRHLRPGGLYIIDLDARRQGVGVNRGEWGRQTLPLANGWVEMWQEEFPGDWVRNISHMTLHCRVCQDGVIHETVDDWHLRVYNPWDLTVLVSTLAGWRLDGFYRWQDLGREIAAEKHYLMVLAAV
jgi:SAM-dependent methyltransferase